MKFIKMTQDVASGTPVLVNLEQITSVQRLNDNASRIYFDKDHYVAVKGPVDVIGDAIKAASK